MPIVNDWRIALCVAAIVLSGVSAGLFRRGYVDRRDPSLMWSAAFFSGLTLNNIVLLIDVAVLPAVDLRFWRLILVLLSVACLFYGFLWSERDSEGETAVAKLSPARRQGKTG
jgi:hypothetical protein